MCLLCGTQYKTDGTGNVPDSMIRQQVEHLTIAELVGQSDEVIMGEVTHLESNQESQNVRISNKP